MSRSLILGAVLSLVVPALADQPQRVCHNTPSGRVCEVVGGGGGGGYNPPSYPGHPSRPPVYRPPHGGNNPRPPHNPPYYPPHRPPSYPPPVYRPPVHQPPVYQPPVYRPPVRPPVYNQTRLLNLARQLETVLSRLYNEASYEAQQNYDDSRNWAVDRLWNFQRVSQDFAMQVGRYSQSPHSTAYDFRQVKSEYESTREALHWAYFSRGVMVQFEQAERIMLELDQIYWSY